MEQMKFSPEGGNGVRGLCFESVTHVQLVSETSGAFAKRKRRSKGANAVFAAGGNGVRGLCFDDRGP